MSRSGYSYDLEQWALIRWRGAVASAIRGKRGQTFLRELRDALDAMPVKELIQKELYKDGEICTLGAALQHKKLDATKFDPYDHEGLGAVLDIAPCLVQEIENENDEFLGLAPAGRWQYMRKWVEDQIAKPAGEVTEATP